MVRSEGNMSLKNPVTPPGIDPGTVRLEEQRLNHYATPVMCLYTVFCLEKIIKHSLLLLLPLAFTSGCLSYKTSAVVNQHIWTQFSTVPLLNSGNFMKEPSAMFIRERSHVFGGGVQIVTLKMKFQLHVTPHSTV
jgi:hypothetical protein